MYIAGILEKEGIKAEILILTPGTQRVVARLKSTRWLILRRRCCCGAHWMWRGREAKWTVDPFAGVGKDGSCTARRDRRQGDAGGESGGVHPLEAREPTLERAT